MLAQALRQCGNDLCRENAIRQAISLGDYHPSILPPGIKINTGPENRPIRQMRLIQFDGSTWLPIGDLIETAFADAAGRWFAAPQRTFGRPSRAGPAPRRCPSANQ